MLEVRELAVGFRLHGSTQPAVRGLSFSMQTGSTLALVGESGSGKSVTAQAIMGLLPDSARILGGQILFHEPDRDDSPARDLLRLPPEGAAMRAIRGGRISMIFQEPMVSLSPLHTIGDQISEALFLHHQPSPAEGLRLTREMLHRVGFPDPARALKTYPFELSGGLRQRAMIAMALVCRPALLIADEPTTALDVTIQAQILDLLRSVQSDLGMAVLLITHDLGVVANLADHVVVMYHGQVMESGPVTEVFEQPRHPYLRALHRAVPRFDMPAGERLQPVREIEHETGPLLADRAPWPEAFKQQPHLRVRGVSKAFQIRNQGWFDRSNARIRAVADVSFDIMPGECFGLVGESGCGKTTLSKILMRAMDADAGRIEYNDRGRPVELMTLKGRALEAFRPRMQFMFQDPFSSLNPRMSVFDIIREPLLIHRVGNADSQAGMAKELMRLVGLDPRFLNRYPHSFSGGQRQRIGIARALALRPDLLICDEPVSALDVSIQAQVLNLLKDLQRELGLTYLFISHNLAVVDYIAKRIAVMCQGRIVETAGRETLFSAPQHPYTRALLAAVPHPDLNHRLDFAALRDGRASEPQAWPAPYRLAADAAGEMREVTPGHWVRFGDSSNGIAA